MRRFYVVTLVSGALCLPLSLLVSLYLGRIEPLIPVVSAGPSLMLLSGAWKGLILDKNPVFLSGRTYLRAAIRILLIGTIVNLLTAILGTALRTGFSLSYAASMLLGLVLPFTGALMVIAGMRSGKKKLAHASKSPDAVSLPTDSDAGPLKGKRCWIAERQFKEGRLWGRSFMQEDSESPESQAEQQTTTTPTPWVALEWSPSQPQRASVSFSLIITSPSARTTERRQALKHTSSLANLTVFRQVCTTTTTDGTTPV